MSNSQVKTLKPHVSLNVRNVGESVEFYKKFFGIEPVKYIKAKTITHSVVREELGLKSDKARVGYAKFDVEHPALNFVLNEVPYIEGGTLSHLGIQVESTDDVLKMRERWIADGLMTIDEMKIDCCYALQDKTWARDPDGNEWEVFVVLENTEPQAEACACGGKVQHHELSTEVCCTPDVNPTKISRSEAACC